MSRDLESENEGLIALTKSLTTFCVVQTARGVELQTKIESVSRDIHFLLKDAQTVEREELCERLKTIQAKLRDVSEVVSAVARPWRFDAPETYT